jgi:DNA-binding NarL/FixJ family response regulator
MDSPTPQLHGIAKLTHREHEVMEWVTQGKSNGDIGQILVCAERTVKKHLWHIFPKLGVETRMAAALVYLEWKAQVAEATGPDSSVGVTTGDGPGL